MTRRVVVIGGGIVGFESARRLARAGDQVVLLEAAPQVGGLVAGFEIGGRSLERYYHYVLPQESAVQDLLAELDLLDDLEWFPGRIAILTDGRVWPFTSPLDLLRFTPLTPLDRVRAGIGALRLGRVRDWPELDDVPAIEWLAGLTSPAVADVVWKPLLRAKFGPAAGAVPAAWMWSRLDQRRRAHEGRTERVGYLRGGFGRLFDALAKDLRAHGGVIHTGRPAREVLLDGSRVTGVRTDAGVLPADVVVYAGPLPRLAELVDESQHDPRWRSQALGAVCMVLELRRPMTDVFWTNVCDADLPFGGIIEHTNLVPASWYGGSHVAYLSRYFTHDEDIASADLDEVRDAWLDAAKRAFPHLTDDDVLGVDTFRTPYAAPLVRVPYVPQVAPMRSHLDGLVLATTAQVYPQDRGMDQGVRMAARVLEVFDDDRWRCPVCGGTDRTSEYHGTGAGAHEGEARKASRPSSEEHGQPAASMVTCTACGHRMMEAIPAPSALIDGSARGATETPLAEEPARVEMADLGLAKLEQVAAPGRLLVAGCWTGSFLVAARRRGWEVTGIGPAASVADEARQRGVVVHQGELGDAPLVPASFDAIVSCDVLVHLDDPGTAVARFAELLRPGGALYVTVPDAGSRGARRMSRRRTVVPVHLQYFSRSSMHLLLSRHGFDVHSVAMHPKRSSVRHHALRAASFVPGLGARFVGLVEGPARDDRPIGPDVGDRMEVVAVRRPATTGTP